MADRDHVSTETIACPLCLGEGKLRRTEVLERLGVRDFARVAQLSAEEAFRLVQQKHSSDNEHVWARFEAELTKRTAEIELRHRNELHTLAGQKGDLNRKVEDYLREVAQLRERNQELEGQMAKVSRIGKREEMDFADEARTWAGICVSEKLSRNGDFILAYRDPSGAPMEPRMLIDNKDKAIVGEHDIEKLVRDACERSISIAVLVAHSEEQLRQVDKDARWGIKDGVWILRTTRQWLPRDLDVLKPLFERIRFHGADFLEKNAAVADEVRRTFVDLDRIEGELKKASKAISSATGLVAKYRDRLQGLCENAAGTGMPPVREQAAARIAQ